MVIHKDKLQIMLKLIYDRFNHIADIINHTEDKTVLNNKNLIYYSNYYKDTNTFKINNANSNDYIKIVKINDRFIIFMNEDNILEFVISDTEVIYSLFIDIDNYTLEHTLSMIFSIMDRYILDKRIISDNKTILDRLISFFSDY